MTKFFGADEWRSAADGYAGMAGGGDGFGSEPALIEGSAFVHKGSLTAVEALPDAIILRAFNCWDKNRCEAHEIWLK